MKAFSYERASTPTQAAAAIAARPGAKFVAGGTNLLDLMKLQIETPAHLVDVNDLALNRIEPTADGGLRVGALVRNTDLAANERVRRDYGVLSRALLAGASGQLRNQATTAGNLMARPQPTDLEFRERMSGNICRCGAYSNIQEAIAEVAGVPGVTGAKT